ncbi:hypothetical protein A500_07264 [Clostridium sartagoforme AAU1]|uniref:Two-component sensor histidine kinase n=2 Tax=root TaxID=1 RepID=R9CHH5_9CLOT|nr:hypothetical protein [Clostridium sartagoforme]EOR26656.1 hypothetical protein A500_07264 [Clostridium sartagoforme AAU1]
MKGKSVIYRLLVAFSSITSIILILVGMILTAWINKEYSSQRIERIDSYMAMIQELTSEFLNGNGETGYDDLKK